MVIAQSTKKSETCTIIGGNSKEWMGIPCMRRVVSIPSGGYGKRVQLAAIRDFAIVPLSSISPLIGCSGMTLNAVASAVNLSHVRFFSLPSLSFPPECATRESRFITQHKSTIEIR